LDWCLRGRHHRGRHERRRRADRWAAAAVPRPDQIHRVAAALKGEVSKDPHDFVASHLLRTASGSTGNAVLFGVVCLLARGIVQSGAGISAADAQDRPYPWRIVVLFLLIGYQLYRIALDDLLA
jgi:uncharacterized membrane protein